ncbi:MAG: branched-chain amino acid ABC transporter permease, partial [Halobacteriota archaeon]
MIRERLDTLSARQRWGVAGVALIGMLAVPQISTNLFLMNTFIYAFIFIGLGQSWNIIGGYAEQFSLGHAVMFAVGAYATAILFIR